MTQSLVHVVAGRASSGQSVLEEVPVEPLSGNRWRVLQSPGVVLGVAADDVIELIPDGEFNVISRGRNVCVQVYAPSTRLDGIHGILDPLIHGLGGRLDGRVARNTIGVLVYTIPVDAGFPAIETVVKSVEDLPSVEWFYGNVYAADGVTPLNWW